MAWQYLAEAWCGNKRQSSGNAGSTPAQQSVCGKNIERRHEGICCHWNHQRPASSRVNSKLDRVSMQQPSLHVWIRCVCRERVALNLVRPQIGAWGRFGRKLTLLPGQKRRETVTLNNGRGQARERERERERDTEEGREKFPALRRYTKATPTLLQVWHDTFLRRCQKRGEARLGESTKIRSVMRHGIDVSREACVYSRQCKRIASPT